MTFSIRISGSDANAPTERMRVSDYGLLGIGTNTPDSGPNTSVASILMHSLCLATLSSLP